VTRHLSEHDGIAPDRLAAIGFGEWHPIAPNTTEANRLLNRRVDIVVLRYKDS
jgi:chemotaxis protein MotB